MRIGPQELIIVLIIVLVIFWTQEPAEAGQDVRQDHEEL